MLCVIISFWCGLLIWMLFLNMILCLCVVFVGFVICGCCVVWYVFLDLLVDGGWLGFVVVCLFWWNGLLGICC